MSVQAAQAKALQQLQALSLRLWTVKQTLTAPGSIISTFTSTDKPSSRITSQQTYMTTGEASSGSSCSRQNMTQQQQQQVLQKGMEYSRKQTTGPAMSSPISSISDYCNLDRSNLTVASACTKSAKRKAAEALLAARYSSVTAAAAVAAVETLPAPAAAVQLQNKRHRSSLTNVIDKLLQNSGTTAGTTQASSGQAWVASAPDNATQHQPQLANLQQELERLHGQHQQLIQQPQHHQQVLQQHQQQQQQGQQRDHTREGEDLGTAVAADSTTGLRQQQQQPQYVQVPACKASCSHSFSNGWCHTQVRLPHMDWGRVLEADLAKGPSFRVAQGYERITLPEGVQVLVVENPAYLQNALQQLRASMNDSIVAIDLEWRPSFGRRFTPVAMIQLASSKTAVLIRACRMSYRLPAPLKDFLKDPAVTLVGFSWRVSDEPKMQSTFGVGCKDFGNFLDLQAVAQGLGYSGFGLARLTRHVLGLHMPKSKKVSMSDWEAAVLSKSQVKYAALDVLAAGQVFRALRLWHSSPSLCEVCHYNLGTSSASSSYLCTCGKTFNDIKGYLSHCAIANHTPKWAECSGCGCTRQLPWPTGAAQAEMGHAGSDSSSGGQSQR